MDVYNLHTMQKEEGVSSPLAVVLGNFDGVHAGHADLITRAVTYAKVHGIASAVWTFADGAASLPNKPDARAITTTEEKLALIGSMGVDFAILESFEAVRGYTPERFVNELLIGKCGAAAAVCGFNFRFGAGGIGTGETLAALMAPRPCIIVPPVYVGDMLVSSTAIRACIEAGDMEGAAAMLGRPFSLTAPVVHGKELGRTIGIPRAVSSPKTESTPAEWIHPTAASPVLPMWAFVPPSPKTMPTASTARRTSSATAAGSMKKSCAFPFLPGCAMK